MTFAMCRGARVWCGCSAMVCVRPGESVSLLYEQCNMYGDDYRVDVVVNIDKCVRDVSEDCDRVVRLINRIGLPSTD